MFWSTQTKLKGLTPAIGASPNFVLPQKVLSDSNNYKTNKGRVVGHTWSWFPSRSDYLAKLKNVLIEIGEEDLLKGTDEAAIMECVARLRAKMGATTQYGVFLTNGITLWPDGRLCSVSPTNKNIKF